MTRLHSTSIHTATQTCVTLALLLAASGCEEYPLQDLGYTGVAASPVSGAPAEPAPPVPQFASEFAGVWIGEAEDPFAPSNPDGSPALYRFPSGSSRILLEIDASSESFATGFITFGDTAPPPPATDPDVGYPLDPDFFIESAGAKDYSVRPPVDGFAYSFRQILVPSDLDAAGLTWEDEIVFHEEGRVVDGKIEISFHTLDVMQSWCALQTAETCPGDEQISWDDEGGCFMGDEFTPMDCHKMALCASNVCQCYEDEPCTISVRPGSELTLRFSGSELVGLFNGAVFVNERGFRQPLGAVRFRRAEAP